MRYYIKAKLLRVKSRFMSINYKHKAFNCTQFFFNHKAIKKKPKALKICYLTIYKTKLISKNPILAVNIIFT